MKKELKVEEVAVLVGISVHTLNIWYSYKKQNPNDVNAKKLPKFHIKKVNGRLTRLWDYEDIPAIIAYKESIPKGRNGYMGSITNKKGREKWPIPAVCASWTKRFHLCRITRMRKRRFRGIRIRTCAVRSITSTMFIRASGSAPCIRI